MKRYFSHLHLGNQVPIIPSDPLFECAVLEDIGRLGNRTDVCIFIMAVYPLRAARLASTGAYGGF